MTPREVTPTHFPNLAATLFADCTVIALTPATNDVAWAATATWSAARAVARAGRRVGLIDLSLERPVLHEGARDTADEGIVDAFTFGVSMGHVAREQEPDLYFISVGSIPTDPNEVWANARWQRLARGFHQEGAALLLFVPPAVLPRLNLELDGLVVLSPVAYAPDGLTFPGIGERLKQGTRLIAIVCNERSVPRPTPPPARRRSRGMRPSPMRPAVRPAVVVAVGVIGLAAVLAVALGVGSDEAGGGAEGAGATGGVGAAAAPAPSDPGDSLFYSVQIAAFSQADQAAAYAEDFDAVDGATVSPVQLGRQGLWFRVVVGAFATAGDADSLLRAWWQRGTVERPNGTILRTPHALLVEHNASPEAARETAQGLRRQGVAAYIVPAPDGSALVLVGAFETPDQAGAADSLLRLTGLQTTLAYRMGTRQ
jgi:hypothetical protein